MLYTRRNCNVIIAFLLLCSMIAPAGAESLLVNGTGIFLTTGDSWHFYQGYVFEVKSVNLEQKQVWVKLRHGDEFLKESILSEGESFVYSKDEEILNITVDTIYESPSGELITFQPIYQYQDKDLPEPVLGEDDPNQSNESELPGDDITRQTNGFTILQTVACISTIMACRHIFQLYRK